MGTRVCPSCNYRAKDKNDDLYIKYNGLGECPQCGIIYEKYIKRQFEKNNSHTESKNDSYRDNEKERWHEEKDVNNDDAADDGTINSAIDHVYIYDVISNTFLEKHRSGINLNYAIAGFIAFLLYVLSASFTFFLITLSCGLGIAYLANNNKINYLSDYQIFDICFLSTCIKLASINEKFSEKNCKLLDGIIQEKKHCNIFSNYKIDFVEEKDKYNIYDYLKLVHAELTSLQIEEEYKKEWCDYLKEVCKNTYIPFNSTDSLLLTIKNIFQLDDDFFSDGDNNRNEKNWVSKSREDFYRSVLGCSENSTADEIKRQFRMKSRIYHPDVIASKDLPDDFIKFANEKFLEIKEAYDYLIDLKT